MREAGFNTVDTGFLRIARYTSRLRYFVGEFAYVGTKGRNLLISVRMVWQVGMEGDSQ